MLTQGRQDELKTIVSNLSYTQAKSSIWKIVSNLVLAGKVYYIWQERNWRTFKQKKRTVDQVLKMITENVKLRLMSFKRALMMLQLENGMDRRMGNIVK
ncbi:hypothetical protein Tco_1481887, partial [Tanacetum coccineum]